jgi:hypothetical protein
MSTILSRVVVVAVLCICLTVNGIVQVQASARSVEATIINQSNATLLLSGNCKLDHGILSQSPEAAIPPSSTATFLAESDGFMTGTEGTCVYTISGVGSQVIIYWDNPFIGANTFGISLKPTTPLFTASYNANTGNNAQVTYTIKNPGTAVARSLHQTDNFRAATTFQRTSTQQGAFPQIDEEGNALVQVKANIPCILKCVGSCAGAVLSQCILTGSINVMCIAGACGAAVVPCVEQCFS